MKNSVASKPVNPFAQFVSSARASGSLPPVVPVDRSGVLPASFEQERMWLLNQIHGDRPVYNEGLPLVLRGRVDTAALVTAVQGLLDRYEVLRTRLEWREGRLVQAIDPVGSLRVVFEDWSARGADLAELEAEAEARATALLAAPYDLGAEAPCRALVLKLSAELHVWALATHHVVGDNWSLSHVMPADFLALYEAAVGGREAALPEIRLRYADYAAWQRSAALAAVRAEQLAYWRERLDGIPEALDLPSDRRRPPAREHRGSRLEAARFTAAEWRSLERFAVAHDTTPFMVFVAGLNALLHRVTGSDDIVLGTPHVMKPSSDLWPEFGYFGNTLALRTAVDGGAGFEALLARSRRTVLEAFRHQEVAFEEVVEALGVVPSNMTPVFQVLLVMHAFLDEAALRREDFEIGQLGALPPVAKYDLTVDINPGSEGVSVSIKYATDLFEAATVGRLGSMYRRLLLAAVAAPETAVADLPLLDDAERRQVVAGFNETAADYPRDKTVVELFAAQAATAPDNVAVVDGDRKLSYGELDAASSRLARHLIGLGVGPEVVVGVCLERSAELIVALLGIWKAGGAYLPLDPDYPAERLSFMASDAGARLIVTSAVVADSLSEGLADLELVLLDATEMAVQLADQSDGSVTDAECLGALTPSSLAYVIYTSGSTGKPKGVMVGHGQLTAYLSWLDAAVEPGLVPKMLMHTQIGFDMSLREFLLPLCRGGSLHRIGQDLIGSDIGSVEASMINAVICVPTSLRMMLNRGDPVWLSRLEFVYCGGEPLLSDVRHRAIDALGEAQLLQGYGPTETTCNVTAEGFADSDDQSGQTIGAPISNTQVYVVDERLEPQPLGVAGELLIGGVQVARGYLGRAGLTAEKFIADPFSGEAGSRLYRTGDLARWRPDGTLEFLGRIDHQVKIRGMRVELGEIESALAACEGVTQAVVVAPRSEGGDQRLVAYLVPGELPDGLLAQCLGIAAEALKEEQRAGVQVVALEGVLDLETVRAALKRHLPAHMVPTEFVGLSRLPLTPSGKVDRKALPSAPISRVQVAYVGPQDTWEQLVADAFGELLEVPRVGRADEFFELGGNSLLAVRLAALLEQSTENRIDLPIVFENPTVADLASALRTLHKDSHKADIVGEHRPAAAAF